MGRIWSDENKYRCWLKVEAAASQALAQFGLVPQEAANAIRDRGNFTVERINAIEAEVRHDVIAFTTTVAEHIANP
jgi:adenylosuccinate lyase